METVKKETLNRMEYFFAQLVVLLLMGISLGAFALFSIAPFPLDYALGFAGFVTGGFAIFISLFSVHKRLKSIFYGYDLGLIWGGYIVLSLIPAINVLTLLLFFLPEKTFEKKVS